MVPTPRMVICTRFGLGVTAPEWFEHRLLLLEAITAASLRSQTDQQFVWLIFIDSTLPAEFRERLSRITAECGQPVLIDDAPHNSAALLQIATRLQLAEGDFLLTARIDDDDAWHRETVERVRSHCAAWLAERSEAPGLALTFPKGLEWLMYDMVDVDKLRDGRRIVRKQAVRPYTFPFHSMSVFVLSRTEDKIVAISGSHTKMHAVLQERQFTIIENAEEDAMWLYVRHKQTVSGLQKARGDGADWTLAELADRFGINPQQTEAYIRGADRHGYTIEKRTVFRRTSLTRRLHELEETIVRGEHLNPNELIRERDLCQTELERISSNLVGPLDR
jgi:hypothetical protein